MKKRTGSTRRRQVGVIVMLTTLATVCACSAQESTQESAKMQTFPRCEPDAVIFVQDGAVDELMASVLLMQAHKKGQIRYVGEIVTDGDTLLTAAMDTMFRIRKLIGVTDVPLTASSARAVNPFPYTYRQDALKALNVPLLNALGKADYPYADGDAALVNWLNQSSCAVTLAVVGPLTPVVMALQAKPDLESKISRIVWMGGAIDVKGNVLEGVPPPLITECAEWNAFWDADAVDFIFRQTSIPFFDFSLDATPETAKVQPFLERAAELENPSVALRLAIQFYDLVKDEPFYRLWDTIAVGSILDPNVYWAPTTVNLEVNTSRVGGHYGCLTRSQSGRPVEAMLDPPDVFVPDFISYYVDSLQAGGD
jgi:purine nucleosidase